MEAIYCRKTGFPGGIGSFVLRTALWSPWSHCGVVTANRETVIHADAIRGVVEDDYDHFTRVHDVYEIKTIIVPDDVAAITFARDQKGKKYDWAGVFGIAFHRDWTEDDCWFCSELVEAAAVAGGRRRFSHDAWRVNPQHSWMVL